MRFLNSFIGIVVAILLVLFAVTNRTEVDVGLWPFPVQVTLGLYAVILLAVLVGFMAGVIGAWMTGAGQRRERKRLRAQVRELEQNLADAQRLDRPLR